MEDFFSMRKLIFAMGLAGSLIASPSAFAGVRVEIGWDVAPPVYEVTPGVSVVEDYDEEVFFTDGYYWVERDGIWYRSRDWHRSRWVVAPARRVPVFLVNHHRGDYRHWRHEEHRERVEERHEERKEERHEEKREEHEHKHGH